MIDRFGSTVLESALFRSRSSFFQGGMSPSPLDVTGGIAVPLLVSFGWSSWISVAQSERLFRRGRLMGDGQEEGMADRSGDQGGV
jgi:hypothetical protein